MNTKAFIGKTIAHFNSFENEIAIAFTDGTTIALIGVVHSIDLPAPRAHASDGECVHRKRILCADGHSISAQASSYHWCEPRDNRFANLWLYEYVELGYPELPDGTTYEPAELEEHREHDSSIYTYVPIRALAAFVQAHGGQIGGGEIVTNY